MKLREFLPVLIFATIGASFAATAQQADKVHRIGHLVVGPVQPAANIENNPFRRALRARGLIEGRNVVTDRRFAATEREARPLAAGDLMSTGLVASLARPGGNVSGVQVLQTDLAGKRLSVLRELAPGLRKATALAWAPLGSAVFASFERDFMRAGAGLGIAVQMRGLGSAGPGPIFAEMAAQRIQGLLVMAGSGTSNHRVEIFELALKHRIATLCDTSFFVHTGCLASYGFSGEEVGQQAAAIVEKILKGANPAEIPVEQPTKFEFVINLKTAKALGIVIPQSVLIRADEVIQ